jgi:outer membrane protein
MKKFLLLLPLIILLNHVAMAADQPAIGYVDVRKVLLESKLGKKNKAEFEKIIKEKESALGKEEEKLKAMQESFQKDQLMMTDEQKKSKQKAFQEKAEAYQKMMNILPKLWPRYASSLRTWRRK